jgi:hypothetical protein
VKELLEKLAIRLNADGKPGVWWERSSEDADLRVVMNNAAIPDSTKVILLGAAWNYHCIESDGSEGIHNPAFAKSILKNTIAVLDDPKVKATIPYATW